MSEIKRPLSTHSKSRNTAGFALVISLSLMAFILLLLLTLTTMTKVEQQSSSTLSRTLSAKQNALLGLHIALGELQQSAGADAVATGPISVDSTLSPHADKRYWTAVWANAGSYDSSRNLTSYSPSLQKILVSGDDQSLISDIANSATPDWPILVGSDTVNDPSDRVSAPPVTIESNTNDQGVYAYWISDEASKARIDLYDDLATTRPNDPRRMLVMPRTGTQLMREDTSTDSQVIGTRFPSDELTLSKFLSIDQIDLSPSLKDSFRKAHFHNLSLHSRGVLSDQRRGGLRQDLTWMLKNNALPTGYLYQEPVALLNRTSVPGPAWSLLQDFYDASTALETTGALQPTTMMRQIGNSAGHRNAINPILTQLKLYFNFSFSDPDPGTDGGNLRMHMFPLVVLYNPYNAPLAAADYQFNFQQHNSLASTELLVNVETSSGPMSFGGYKFKDGNNALFDPKPHNGSNDFSGMIFFNARNLSFAPGEVKVLTLADNGEYLGNVNTSLVNALEPRQYNGNELVEDFNDFKSAYLEFQDTLPDGTTPNFYEFQLVNSGYLRFKMRLIETTGESYFNNYDGIGYSAGTNPTSALAEQGENLVIFPKAGFSYKVDVDSIRYLANYNLRGSYVVQTGYDTDPNIPPRLFRGAYGLGDFTTDHVANTGSAYFGIDHTSAAQNRVTLFEIPDDPNDFISIGQFQHIDLSVRPMNQSSGYDQTDPNAPSYTLGNSNGNPSVLRTQTYYNDSTQFWYSFKTAFDTAYRANEAIWDGYFLSTLDLNTNESNLNPGNHRFELLPPIDQIPTTPYGAAENMLILGAFNVNSNSVEAWRALLGGLQEYTLTKIDNSQQSDLDYLFARLTKPYGDAINDDDITDPSNSHVWNGVRELTESDIIALADAIVDEVEARGPFLSLADFINRDLVATGGPNEAHAVAGALQSAINTVNLNANLNGPAITLPPESSNYPEPTFYYGNIYDSAPANITQADLLTPIAPILSARSDTFVIRSYGKAVNPLNEESNSQAWLEAVVQRCPDKVDPSESIETAAVSTNFGRQFRILSLQWIDPQI
ncbi:hypothetical protein [Puniceicoccus vermicola]|uniref:Verru_Chthon cassette protein A n=1 Tax=Puniceicoccus vermicola TaxID=388746 RepID=A0A7X1AZU9_9BACT|nr:hypothetical protein [Puniceicoccus vermicola]MBC2602969.1 hypothetical protein [Puniceicoccus vermicola]